MSGHFFRMAAGHLPVPVGELSDNLAPFFQGLQHQGNVKFPAESTFHADFDIIEVYENSKLKLFFHEMVIARPVTILARLALCVVRTVRGSGWVPPSKRRTHLLPQTVLTTQEKQAASLRY